MLLHHGARFFLLHSALARLALMSLCYSPTSPSTSAIPAAWQQHHARPAKKRHHLAVEDQPPLPVVFNKADGAKKTAASRGRPPRLVIPPPVPCAAPFGAAADRETDDVATEVEVQGQGFCLATRRGVRHAMEDGYAVITAVDDHIAGGSRMAFYGVYDGHGGRGAVDFVADKLCKNVAAAASQQEEEDEVIAAIRSAYLTTDSDFLSQGVRGGACAATALVKDGELYVANVGDCRAVLCNAGRIATALTSDHTAGCKDEWRRI